MVPPPGSVRAFLTSLAVGAATLCPAAATELRDLGPGALPTAISADGGTVGGRLDGGTGGSGPTRAFRWTPAPGLEDLGNRGGGGVAAVSADGQVLVGKLVVDSARRGRAFRWVRGQVSALLPDGDAASVATGVSKDGGTIVGTRQPAGWPPGTQRAFRWTIRGAADVEPPSGATWTEAVGVSGDGATLAGTFGGPGGTEAFVWTAERGLEPLGTLPGSTESAATAISADGRVIVGMSGERAFRWTRADGLRALAREAAFLPLALSADGRVIAGAIGEEAYLWTGRHGLQSVADVLAAAGLAVDGWAFSSVTAVSADGTSIAGEGKAPARRGWVVRGLELRPLARATALPTPRPAIVAPPVLGARRTVQSREHGVVTVSGTVVGTASRVLFRVGNGSFRSAEGTSNWRLSTRLPAGRHVISIVAEGPGGKSAPVRVVVQPK